MLDFEYGNATRLIFGRDAETRLVNYAAKDLPAGSRLLVVYGGGSAVRSGLLERVLKAAKANGLDVVTEGGVRPNPEIGLVRVWRERYRDAPPAAVLAVGGGSVIDAAKAGAVAFKMEDDVWRCFTGEVPVKDALPVYTILTLPAAGSEQSVRAVLSCGKVKTGIGNECIRPRASAVNPELFFTLPRFQIAAGVVDMMSHIMERYFTNTTATDFTDAQAEAALKTALTLGPKLVQDPENYDLWSQIALVGSFAHNGYFGMGREEDWASHGIEHEISGWRDAITHGAGLAVVIPAWMRFVGERNPKRVADFARRVMGVEAHDDKEAVEKGIEALKAFYGKLGMPITMRELGAADAPIEELAAGATRKGLLGKYVPLSAKDVEAILRSAY